MNTTGGKSQSLGMLNATTKKKKKKKKESRTICEQKRGEKRGINHFSESFPPPAIMTYERCPGTAVNAAETRSVLTDRWKSCLEMHLMGEAVLPQAGEGPCAQLRL